MNKVEHYFVEFGTFGFSVSLRLCIWYYNRYLPFCFQVFTFHTRFQRSEGIIRSLEYNYVLAAFCKYKILTCFIERNLMYASCLVLKCQSQLAKNQVMVILNHLHSSKHRRWDLYLVGMVTSKSIPFHRVGMTSMFLPHIFYSSELIGGKFQDFQFFLTFE